MKSKIFVIIVFCVGLSAAAVWAQPARFSRAELIRLQNQPCGCDEPAEMALALNTMPALFFADSLITTSPPPQRSAGKAFLFSAIIPGTGQFYNKSLWKGLVFLGIEVGAWVTYGIYTGKGNDQTVVFESYADAHWFEDKYWESLARRSGCDVNNMACLKEYERTTYSHFLPETRNQTYYENIGKYDQFNGGWDDGSGEASQRDSANREYYTGIRKTANDYFKTATYGASLALINHLFSAFEAAYATHQFNRQHTKASMGMELQRYNNELTPALAIKMSW